MLKVIREEKKRRFNQNVGDKKSEINNQIIQMVIKLNRTNT